MTKKVRRWELVTVGSWDWEDEVMKNMVLQGLAAAEIAKTVMKKEKSRRREVVDAIDGEETRRCLV